MDSNQRTLFSKNLPSESSHSDSTNLRAKIPFTSQPVGEFSSWRIKPPSHSMSVSKLWDSREKLQSSADESVSADSSPLVDRASHERTDIGRRVWSKSGAQTQNKPVSAHVKGSYAAAVDYLKRKAVERAENPPEPGLGDNDRHSLQKFQENFKKHHESWEKMMKELFAVAKQLDTIYQNDGIVLRKLILIDFQNICLSWILIGPEANYRSSGIYEVQKDFRHIDMIEKIGKNASKQTLEKMVKDFIAKLPEKIWKINEYTSQIHSLDKNHEDLDYELQKQEMKIEELIFSVKEKENELAKTTKKRNAKNSLDPEIIEDLKQQVEMYRQSIQMVQESIQALKQKIAEVIENKEKLYQQAKNVYNKTDDLFCYFLHKYWFFQLDWDFHYE